MFVIEYIILYSANKVNTKGCFSHQKSNKRYENHKKHIYCIYFESVFFDL